MPNYVVVKHRCLVYLIDNLHIEVQDLDMKTMQQRQLEVQLVLFDYVQELLELNQILK
jgi:hypothetical protein